MKTKYDEMWAIKLLVLFIFIFLFTAIISALVFSGGIL
jgi:hypothetical protein